MVSPPIAGMLAGFILFVVAATTKNQKWQVAYGTMGLVVMFFSLGFFSFGRVTMSLMPPLAIFFGLSSFYTKGNAQMISMLVTIVLVLQLVTF